MMAKNGKKGGFLRGALYGLVLSLVIFIGLVFGFPLDIGTPQPGVMDVAQLSPQGADVASGQDTGAGVVVGGAGDSPPVTVEQMPVVNEETAVEPDVASESADRPVIGDGTDSGLTQDNSGDNSTDSVVVAGGADETTGNSAPPSALEPATSGNAFDVFSASVDLDSNKRLMAIVLLDTLDGSLQGLLETGLPFTFAIPAGQQSAGAGQSLRELGYEVLAMMPEDISADGDVSGRISGYLENVPVSVAVLDNDLVSLLRDADMSAAMFNAVSASGHGVVSFAGAGDAQAQQVAAATGVPFGTVARIIDSDPAPSAIQESLKQALILSLTKGSSIVYARTSEATIETLIEWLDSDRLDFIQIVPVSTILKQ